MIVYDAHAHKGEGNAECALREKMGILTMLSAGTPEQAKAAFEIARQYPVHSVTVGLHPWHAAEYAVSDMLPWMEQAPLIGEIGLDSVWCDVPMAVQRAAFVRQLDTATAMHKPVVLHTKGCEAEIAEIIAGYDMPIIVHWYSGSIDVLQAYLDRDCYFTIGPDIANNPSVQAVASRVSADRILFETDGMSAVSWAIGDVPMTALPDILTNSVNIAAGLRKEMPERLCEQANANYKGLLHL